MIVELSSDTPVSTNEDVDPTSDVGEKHALASLKVVDKVSVVKISTERHASLEVIEASDSTTGGPDINQKVVNTTTEVKTTNETCPETVDITGDFNITAEIMGTGKSSTKAVNTTLELVHTTPTTSRIT